MNKEYILGIICLLILSVIVNTVFTKIVSWVKKKRDSHGETHIPSNNSRPERLDISNLVPPRPNAPSLPGSSHQNTSVLNSRNSSSSSSIVVALPNGMPVLRSAGIPNNPLDFPMCPIHRFSNRSGRPQVIFWDRERKMWRCCKNHYFNS